MSVYEGLKEREHYGKELHETIESEISGAGLQLGITRRNSNEGQ